MRLFDVALVLVGAGLGGAARYILGDLISTSLDSNFPWHTFVINISGAFFLGVLMSVLPSTAEQNAIYDSWRLFLGVGLLGGFTTFSTLAYESVALARDGFSVAGAFNLLVTGVVGIVAVVVGMWIGSLAA